MLRLPDNILSGITTLFRSWLRIGIRRKRLSSFWQMSSHETEIFITTHIKASTCGKDFFPPGSTDYTIEI